MTDGKQTTDYIDAELLAWIPLLLVIAVQTKYRLNSTFKLGVDDQTIVDRDRS